MRECIEKQNNMNSIPLSSLRAFHHIVKFCETTENLEKSKYDEDKEKQRLEQCNHRNGGEGCLNNVSMFV